MNDIREELREAKEIVGDFGSEDRLQKDRFKMNVRKANSQMCVRASERASDASPFDEDKRSREDILSA